MNLRLIAVAALVAACIPAAAQAQIKVGTKVGEPRAVEAGSYDSLGRRDPFVSLIASRRSTTDNPIIRASHGLGSLLLADITVTGTARKGDIRFAILQGPDRQSYVAKVNDKIADAIIRRIDAQGVVFVDLPRPGDTNRLQETRKVLRSAEVNR